MGRARPRYMERKQLSPGKTGGFKLLAARSGYIRSLTRPLSFGATVLVAGSLPKPHLFEPLIFIFLLADVLPDATSPPP